jgi:hypothetical protein
MPYLGKSPLHGNYQKLDDFSGDFDGSDATHALAQNSLALTPVTEAAVLISINGVLQEPVTDYTVSGTNITFTTAPAAGANFFGVVLGEQLAIGTPSDATITTAKLATTFITGATDIGAAIVDADLLLVDDGAGGTLRKTAASRLKTYIGGNDPSSADGQALGTASLEWSDLYLADGSVIYFGNDQEIKVTHVADTGLTLKHTATADDKPITLTLQTGETDMAANDVIGKIAFQAPDEGTGTDAILVAAAIQARSEGDFAADANATSLDFMLGASEAAATLMTLNSSGNLSVGDGTAALPSYSNTGDLNTGVYFPAADTVGVVAGGTEQFRFGSIEGGANPIPGGNKNLLLNGGFTVAQRSSVTGIGGTNYVYYGTDGWTHYGTSSSGRYTASQATAGATDGPFRFCLKVDVTTADTDVSGNNISAVLQKMEGQNLQHLHWGQATNDYPLALSFWVKSPKAGTHCVAIYLQEGNDSCTTEYTVDSADTWQYITVDFPSPGSAIGTIDNDANASLWLVFPLMATGSYQATADAWQTGTEGYATSNQQNLLDNTGNDFFLANVQLELGSVSTSFQAEDFGTTLHKCQRYFERRNYADASDTIASGVATTAGVSTMVLTYSEKRAAPTFGFAAATTYRIVDKTNSVFAGTAISGGAISPTTATINLSHNNATTGGAYFTAVSTTHIDIIAEL